MSFFNFLRGVFGMPSDGNANRRGDFPEERPNEFRNPIWNLDDDDDNDEDFSTLNRRPRGGFSFHVDSNPFEIHRFFQQQMDDIMRSFGGFGFGNFGGFGSGNFENRFSLEPPPMESDFSDDPDFSDPSNEQSSLRNQFLKPGFEDRGANGLTGKKMDSDLDDEIPVGAVSKVLLQGPRLDVFEPERVQPSHRVMPRSFGRSMSSKTVTRSNGGIEHQKTSRDSAGNEEVTVTRTIGSRSYTITTKTDAQGRQERVENFVNMEEGDLKEFEKKWGSKL